MAPLNFCYRMRLVCISFDQISNESTKCVWAPPLNCAHASEICWFELLCKWLVQANIRTKARKCTLVHNEVTLVWGLLRLTLIISNQALNLVCTFLVGFVYVLFFSANRFTCKTSCIHITLISYKCIFVSRDFLLLMEHGEVELQTIC